MGSSKRTTKRKPVNPGVKLKTKSAAKPKASPARQGRRQRAPTPKAAAKRSGAPRTIHSPALDRALEAAEVKGYLARLPTPLQPMVTRLRAILLDSAPEALEFLEHERPSYFARGVFARIEPKEREVLVRFLRGGSLPSSGELRGFGEERILKLSSLEELKTEVLRKLVREAVVLNLTLGEQLPAEA
jgi:hypothetical protein